MSQRVKSGKGSLTDDGVALHRINIDAGAIQTLLSTDIYVKPGADHHATVHYYMSNRIRDMSSSFIRYAAAYSAKPLGDILSPLINSLTEITV